MSTRFYTRFVQGNPQLRIFLPDWKLVMIKNKDAPKNVVTLKTDPRMTDWDIKNYLEKIYKVPVAGLISKIYGGELKQTSKGITKLEDYKITRVTLTEGQTFTWPDLFPEGKMKEEMDDYEKTIAELNKERKVDKNSSGLPTWLG